MTDAYLEGLTDGHRAGYEAGSDNGYAAGFYDGHKEGYKAGRLEATGELKELAGRINRAIVLCGRNASAESVIEALEGATK